ncbi:MAG TPA: endolytic transglycosylase MltG, partial [Candidatus Woesebacteria bacterium]|nr:endolytic transglycosylase MltG [Candidatus Woesebacteria bacterium]
MKNSPKKPRSFFYFLLIFVIIVISGWAIFISLLQAPNSSDQSTVTFIIPKGEATQNIAQRLKAEGLIRSPLAFRLALYQQGKQTSIQAGSFKLSPSMSVSELTQVLTKGTDDLWITIPEGWRREEIAASLVKQDL